MAYYYNKKFKKALKTVKSSTEKAKETRAFTARLVDMQRYVDKSPVKRKLLLDTLRSKATDCDKTILEKGAVIFTRLLDIVSLLESDLESEGIEHYVITSKCSQKDRETISTNFMKDSSNKVIIISEAGGESVSLHSTNEIILYDTPNGTGKFSQTIGRTCRCFGKYDEFNVHSIIIEDTLDVYKQILLSSKKELELELLSRDTIPVKEVTTFDQQVLKKIRQNILWKMGKRKQRPE